MVVGVVSCYVRSDAIKWMCNACIRCVEATVNVAGNSSVELVVCMSTLSIVTYICDTSSCSADVTASPLVALRSPPTDRRGIRLGEGRGEARGGSTAGCMAAGAGELLFSVYSVERSWSTAAPHPTPRHATPSEFRERAREGRDGSVVTWQSQQMLAAVDSSSDEMTAPPASAAAAAAATAKQGCLMNLVDGRSDGRTREQRASLQCVIHNACLVGPSELITVQLSVHSVTVAIVLTPAL